MGKRLKQCPVCRTPYEGLWIGPNASVLYVHRMVQRDGPAGPWWELSGCAIYNGLNLRGFTFDASQAWEEEPAADPEEPLEAGPEGQQ